jgi:hypothetical protein
MAHGVSACSAAAYRRIDPAAEGAQAARMLDKERGFFRKQKGRREAGLSV